MVDLALGVNVRKKIETELTRKMSAREWKNQFLSPPEAKIDEIDDKEARENSGGEN